MGGISAILVACVVLYLGHQARFGESRSYELHVSVENMSRLNDATTLTAAVGHRGDETASAVTVLAICPEGSPLRQIEFDYIAVHAVRRGAFVFPGAVVADQILIEIGGYAAP